MTDTLHDLRTLVSGRVLLSGDDGFDEAGRPRNRAVEHPVPAVAEAADAADVAAVVRFARARARGLAVAAQPNGHGATTNLGGPSCCAPAAWTPSRSIRPPAGPASARACPRASSRPPRRRTA